MPRIPEYTTTIIRETAVPNLTDPGAIGRAGAVARSVSQMVDMGQQLALKYKAADEATAVNDAVIAKQRDDIDFIQQARKDRESNPENVAVDVEKGLAERDKARAESLPSRRARRAFEQSAKQINLKEYQNTVAWENERKAQIYASRIQTSIENNNILMMRAGREGGDIDEYLRNVDATTIAASGVFAPEKLEQINKSGRAEGISYWLQGVAERDPAEAKRILDSKKYDADLGASGTQALYKKVESEQARLDAKYSVEIKQEAAAIEHAARLGLSVDDDVIRSLAQKAAGAGLDDISKNLTIYADNQQKAQDFSVISSKDQRDQLNEVAASIEGGDLSRVDEYAVLANVFQNKQKMLSDGQAWEYYAAHGTVHEPEPMDLSDPVSVAQNIEARRGDVKVIRDIEGRDISVLTAAEINGLKEIYENGRPSDVGPMLANLTAALSPDERRSLSQQLERSGAPMLAAAIGQPPEVAHGILSGAGLDDIVKRSAMNDSVRQSLTGYVYDAEVYTGAQNAIISYYKHLSILDGDGGKEIDKNRMKVAVESVMGRAAEISVSGAPSKVFLYRGDDGKYVRPAHVETIFESMTNQSLELSSGGAYPVLSDGQWIDADDIRGKASFITVGDGVYVAEYPGLGMIQSSKGGPFRFDMRAIESNLSTEDMAKGKANSKGQRPPGYLSGGG